MIDFHIRTGHPAGPIVEAALERSVTAGQMRPAPSGPGDAAIAVFVEPASGDAETIGRIAAGGGKVLVLGRPEGEVAARCGLRDVKALPADWADAARCAPAPLRGTSRSAASVRWLAHPLAAHSPFETRPFLRFDYADEWNNLGYGRITADGGQWSIACGATADGATVLAMAEASGCEPVPMVTLFEPGAGSVLWWNRAVGPVDSAEWAVVEAFLADWRHEDRPCVPVVREVPFGHDCAITMRLDCDEDIASARPLFELYRERGLPFSVAIKTEQEDRPDHIELLHEILAEDGAVLSHSVTHAPRWGGSAEACLREARGSVEWLEQRVEGLKVRHAVSPFHQNPPYVPAALAEAGLEGFVGGIVANDPEALLARGGRLPGDASGVVSHSQQCMLHGDCVLEEGDRLAVTKAAFRAATASGALFGFLDHPFSPRYDYGWGSEAHRLDVHAEFLDFIAQETEGGAVLWLNEDQVLDWIGAKARLRVTLQDGRIVAEGADRAAWPFAIRWRGRTEALPARGEG
ncbi:hypothetical protein [Aurantimonas sp. Leaf443]|uniref:hypothetical protein n=1 Tax=Aurantimonas sp. Leaf443 TaxID=1736378 RepID=UPI0006FA8F49|nr:hypothetical protein [Aurantimonas sp. Leaf443]KQT85131.1 hypothetical protein ASG48_07580 [Aurantimonas sp. Leaf443]